MSEKKYNTYYDLEVDELIKEVDGKKLKLVLLQFPDGLKYYAKEVIDELRKNTSAEYFIYFGTCYGACDIPLHLEKLNFDLIVQWGHTNYIKKEEIW